MLYFSSQVTRVAMARSVRPASESYQPVCSPVSQSVSSCSAAGIVGDEYDHAPIFSLSKSSMDVVMGTDPPHKRDPAWTRLDLRRSSSTTTDQNSVTLQKLQHHKWRHNSHHLSFTTQNEDLLSPPPLSERWISNMQRWSGYSGSTHSRSSTPDTVVWKGGPSCQYSLNHEGSGSVGPDSPLSKLASPPTTPSPFISPFDTPTLPSVDLLTSLSSPLTLSNDQLLKSSPQVLLTSTENDDSSEKLSFQFPSPVPSPVSLTDAGVCSDSECFFDNTVKELPSPNDNHLLEDEGEKSQLQMSENLKPNSPEVQESRKEPPSQHLLLPWQAEQIIPTGRVWKSPLVSSLSDSRLGDCCRCSLNTWEGSAKTPKVELPRAEATMTSKLEMVDAAVQTASPLGSSCDLRRNMSSSNTGSHSILGSPPGSRLNLKSPVGSHSNLVSPSSSMFPVSSGEEEEKQRDDPEWDAKSVSPRQLERKRSCLKIPPDERDELGRRCSMKQVQWDEDGLTWDIHGASLDPEELSTAIKKHLELKNRPEPPKQSSKKKKAPKPPVLSNLVTTMTPDMSPPAISIKCMVEGEDTPEVETVTEVQQKAGGTKKETTETSRRGSRTEQDRTNDTEEKVCGKQAIDSPKISTHGNEPSKKKIVIKSLRRPRWCGGSRQTDD